MSELVNKLAVGSHRVIVRPRGEDPVQELKRRLEMGYVHVKFPDTRGGTELGITLINQTDASSANFDSRSGSLRLVGTLKLDYVPVTCKAEIDLSTLEGKGHLEIVTEEEYARLRAGAKNTTN